jgi:hypothetical protein
MRPAAALRLPRDYGFHGTNGQLRLPFGGYTVDGMSITVSGGVTTH